MEFSRFKSGNFYNIKKKNVSKSWFDEKNLKHSL